MMAVAEQTTITSAEADRQVKLARKIAERNKLELQAKRDALVLDYLNSNLQNTRKRKRGWTTPGAPERDYSSMDRQTTIAMVRQKLEESPAVSGMFKRLADNIVGSEFRLSMRTKDKGFNKEVEDRWRLAKDNLDVRGLRRYGRLQRCRWIRSRADGDVGTIFIDGGLQESGKTASFLQIIEGDRIFKNPADPQDVGIDYNKYGRAVRYWVGRRQLTKTGQQDARIKGRGYPANVFSFWPYFPHERVERKRGVSMVLQNLSLFEDFEEIFENMIQKVKNEAFIGLNFAMEAADDGSIFGPDIEEAKTAEDGTTRRHVKMVSGMNINTEPGESVSVIESKSPNGNWLPFVRLVFRLMGCPVGLPLEVFLLDFSDTNYSGGRGVLELAKKGWRIEQDELAYICDREFNWWLSREVKHNDLTVPDEIESTYWAHTWNKPGWSYLDPLKETKAHIEALQANITTLDNVLGETSDMDVEDFADQRQRELETLRERGIIGEAGAADTDGGTESDQILAREMLIEELREQQEGRD